MNLLGDRIQWLALLIVLCFASVLLLRSQSAASYPTYFLALLMLASYPAWRDAFALPLVRWISALLIWLCLSAFWSEPFGWREALSIWIRALLVFCFVIAFAECQLRGKLQHWMGVTLTIVGAGVVLAAIANFYITNPEDGRLNGLGQLDTHVIAALVYGVVLIFVLRTAHTHTNSWLRGVGWLIAAIVVFAIIMSDSRNAWVSVAVGVGTYVLAHLTRDWRQFSITLITLAIVVATLLLILVANETTRDLILPRGDSFRFAIWSGTWERILNGGGLIVGQGVLSSTEIDIGTNLFAHPHNLYLTVVHQGGIVALALYSVVIVTTLWTYARYFESPDAKLGVSILALALTAHLLDGHELIDKVGDTWFLVWMPVSFAIGLSWTPGGRYRD